MPTVEFSTGDFMRLVGRRVPLKEVEERAAMLGTSVEEVSDERIVLEVFPNRPDILSVEGFARAYRTFTGIDAGLRDYRVADSSIKLSVDESVKSVRPFIAAAIIKNLPVTEEVLLSMMQMQEALHSSHGRRRSKVAIGIHDFDKTKPPYEYRAVRPGDKKFIPLDFAQEMTLGDVLEKHPKGVDYKHILEGRKLLPLVLDRDGVVSLPPIINADRTRVTGRTANLLIEMTGTNKPALRHALNIVLAALADRGGQIVSVQVGAEKLDLSPEVMNLKVGYANKLLGMQMKHDMMGRMLSRMGFGIKRADENSIDVLVPCSRADILHPMDLVEDIAIAYGYENFQPEGTKISTIGKADALEEASSLAKTLAIGLGYQETVPFTLTNPATIGKARLAAKPVRIKNPRTEDFTVVRTSAITTLLTTLAYNKKRRIPQKVFELDDVAPGEKDWQNRRMLGLGLLDNEVNFSEMQSAVEAILRGLGTEYKLRESQDKTFIKGRCGEILVKGKRAGVFGEIHPEVLSAFGLEYPAALAEIDVGAVC